MNKTEKEQVISVLHKRVEQFKAVVLTNYRGLNVEQMTQLRRRLREEKISYNVVKNTMMKLAAKGTDLEKLNDYFEGPTAVAISYGDPIPLAKILTEFQKTLPALEIRAVLVEGRCPPFRGEVPGVNAATGSHFRPGAGRDTDASRAACRNGAQRHPTSARCTPGPSGSTG